MPQQPVVVFDVNETLLDLDTLHPVLDRIFHDRPRSGYGSRT